MIKQHKITVRYKNVYREILMTEDSERVRIGTVEKCQVRFDSSNFFENFYAEIAAVNGEHVLSCSDNVYISPDGIMKLSVKNLSHGDRVVLKYQSSNQEIISIDFLMDFESDVKKYDREIDISNISSVKAGGTSDCELKINDELIGSNTITISKNSDKYFIKDNNTEYGVYINGQRIKNESQLYDFDFISLMGCSMYFKYGKLYTSRQVDVSGLSFADIGMNESYPKFSRNTRIRSIVPDEKISILDPPQLPEKPKNQLLSSLVPALAMLALTIVLRGIMGNGGTFVIFSVCSMTIGILTSIFSYISGSKEYKRNAEERTVKYNAYIKNKRLEIEAARSEERNVLDNIYYSIEREEKMLKEFSGDLFDRVKNDEDFLNVRLGTGSLEAQRRIDYKAQEKLDAGDELMVIPEHISDEYKMIDCVPVVCDLRSANGIGVIGSDEKLYDMLKIMSFDICVRQYKNDVKLFYILNAENSRKMSWTRFLPHVYNDMLGMRNIVSDERSRNVIFEYLYKELSRREEMKNTEPHIVIFVYDDMEIKRHPISRFIENAGELGATFIFFENVKRRIPQYCSSLIELNENDCSGRFIQSCDGNHYVDFSYTPVPESSVEYASLRLAPIYCEEISLESTLTKNISLYQLLEITSADDLDLGERWGRSEVFKSMAAPLGVKTKNEVVCLDLHDKFHGPHGLVAGTTGSGKSEILQTYILSMASLFHPYEVSFVIIDFKGGGMVNQFRTLPHLVGAITNIDGREIDRSLKSIKAELRKRQRLFAEAEVNHIDKYIKKFKSGDVKEPLPHLIIIVDEFAELKAEQPEFMKELISAARIGRSLGVHLILATQKPAGQVNEQIWSNSKFKLCLKVQSQSDSNEVLKSPLAAEIKEPGRAYLQVGNNEIFELFQSAYSGCPAKSDESTVKEFSINEVNVSGFKKKVFEQKKPKAEAAEATQLNAVVDYIHDYCEKKNIGKLPDICLPSLAEVITCENIGKKEESGIFCEVGIFDDPDNQYQGSISYDLGGQNTMLIGSSQYGKTNLLEWMIKDLSAKYTPQELNFYILDFGSMVLKNFESLRHVGGVVCASDDEKLTNLFKLINKEIERRKEKLVSVGVSSFNSYREAGYTDIPQMILVIDNLTAMRELYLMENDFLLPVCREGLSVGISVIAANSQLSGIGYKYLSNFANKIGLYCNDQNEYSSLFGTCRMRLPAVPGRAIIEKDKEFYECQTYLAFSGEKEIDRVNEMRDFIKEQNGRYTGGAKMIPVIPKLLDEEFIAQNFGDSSLKPYSFICGLDYSNVSAVVMDLAAIGMLTLCGREKSGRGNFVKHMIASLERNAETAPYEIAIADDISRKFGSLSENCRYIVAADQIGEVITEWHQRLAERYEMLINNDPRFDSEPLLVLVIQNNDVHDFISKDKALLALYKEMLGKYKAMKFCVICSGAENAQVSFNAPETMKMIKDSRQYLVFDDISNIKITDVPLQAARAYKKPIETGDAYYISGGDIAKLKTVLRQQ